MNRHSFINSNEVNLRCSVCYHGPGRCICKNQFFNGTPRLVNGELESVIGEYPPGVAWGSATIATSNTFFAVSGRDNYAIGPNSFVTVVSPAMQQGDGWPQMAVQATGPMFPIN